MHQPVLFQETIDFLLTNPDGIYVDCTLGGGGHLSHLLKFTGKKAQIIAIDRDKEILEASRKKVKFTEYYIYSRGFPLFIENIK